MKIFFFKDKYVYPSCFSCSGSVMCLVSPLHYEVASLGVRRVRPVCGGAGLSPAAAAGAPSSLCSAAALPLSSSLLQRKISDAPLPLPPPTAKPLQSSVRRQRDRRPRLQRLHRHRQDLPARHVLLYRPARRPPQPGVQALLQGQGRQLRLPLARHTAIVSWTGRIGSLHFEAARVPSWPWLDMVASRRQRPENRFRHCRLCKSRVEVAFTFCLPMYNRSPSPPLSPAGVLLLHMYSVSPMLIIGSTTHVVFAFCCAQGEFFKGKILRRFTCAQISFFYFFSLLSR